MMVKKNGYIEDTKYIGSGAAFAVDLKKTSMYLVRGEILFLFECNWDTFQHLQVSKLLDNCKKIVIMISHVHEDHVGGLGTLLYYLQFVKHFSVPNVHILTYDVDKLKTYIDLVAPGNFYTAAGYITDSISVIDGDDEEGDEYRVYMRNTRHCDDMDSAIAILSKPGEKGGLIYTGDTNVMPTNIAKMVNEEGFALITEVTLNDKSNVHLPIGKILEAIGKEAFKEGRVGFIHYDNLEAIGIVDKKVHEYYFNGQD